MQSLNMIITAKTNPTLARSLKAAVILATVNERAALYQAVRFRSGRLTLMAQNPIEAQELVLRQQQLLSDINKLFDEPLVTKLSIRSQ